MISLFLKKKFLFLFLFKILACSSLLLKTFLRVCKFPYFLTPYFAVSILGQYGKKSKLAIVDSNTLNNQPTEILHFIFSFLEKRDLNNLILVSTRFRDFLHQNIPRVWKDITIGVNTQPHIAFEILSIKRYSQLITIDLSHTDLAIQHLQQLIVNQTTIQTLKLYVGPEMRFEKIKLIAEMLKINSTLQCLYLKASLIGYKEIEMITEALKYNSTLQRLDLERNLIGDKEAKMIAEMLKDNRSIEYLGLSRNFIGFGGIKAIIGALNFNKNLFHLNLYRNDIGDPGAILVANLLKFNITLKYLNLGGNEINTEGAKAIAEALKINRTLEYLNLFGNNIGIEGEKSLEKALEVNSILDCDYYI